jgi:hypothetical protein
MPETNDDTHHVGDGCPGQHLDDPEWPPDAVEVYTDWDADVLRVWPLPADDASEAMVAVNAPTVHIPTAKLGEVTQGIVAAAGLPLTALPVVARLADALARLTCDYRESTTDPGTCAWCYAKAGHDRHRTVAAVLAEASDG